MRQFKQNGFTLVELLVVMGILGILIGIGLPSYLKTYRSNQVNQGAREFTAQVAQARAQARRTNSCFRLKVLGGTTSAYTITKYKTPNCTDISTDIETTQTYNMLKGTTMIVLPLTTSNTDTVDFRPPFGINSTGLPIDLQVQYVDDSSLSKQVRVTGVMGTAVIQ